MKRMMATYTVLALLGCAPAGAQTVSERVRSAPDGEVRFSFPAKPGVCGYEESIVVRDPSRSDGGVNVIRGQWNGGDERWRTDCREGPVLMRLLVEGGHVVAVKARVGSDFPAASGRVTQLGALSGADAVSLLLDLASREPEPVGDDALFPTLLAAGADPAPRLVRMALDADVPAGTREKAVFWAAEAGAPAADLARVYARSESRKVREQVLFAYSRLHDPAGAQELLRVARGDDDVELRKKAIFWLSQAAGREITRELGDFVERDDAETDVKEHAIFALSQRPRDEAVPALIHVARTNPDPNLRKKALFWLGQTGDPRAVALFEEILKR